MPKKPIGFIGAGNIASAIISGALSSGYIKPKNVYVYDINPASMAKLSESGVFVSNSIEDMCDQCGIVFLCVKPQVYAEVLPELAKCIKGNTIVSVAAGKTTEYVKNLLGCCVPVIRVMPNTPLLIGKGVTAICATAEVSEENILLVDGLFSASGITIQLDESDFDIATAAGGSMPAFIYRFINSAMSAAMEKGLCEQDARRMVCSTVMGAAQLAADSDDSIDSMIAMVASPGGTTMAGLGALDASGFDDAVFSAVTAAFERAKEL